MFDRTSTGGLSSFSLPTFLNPRSTAIKTILAPLILVECGLFVRQFVAVVAVVVIVNIAVAVVAVVVVVVAVTLAAQRSLISKSAS